MLETDVQNADEKNAAEIAAAQRRLIQLLAKAVSERLADKSGATRLASNEPHEEA